MLKFNFHFQLFPLGPLTFSTYIFHSAARVKVFYHTIPARKKAVLSQRMTPWMNRLKTKMSQETKQGNRSTLLIPGICPKCTAKSRFPYFPERGRQFPRRDLACILAASGTLFKRKLSPNVIFLSQVPWQENTYKNKRSFNVGRLRKSF